MGCLSRRKRVSLRKTTKTLGVFNSRRRKKKKKRKRSAELIQRAIEHDVKNRLYLSFSLWFADTNFFYKSTNAARRSLMQKLYTKYFEQWLVDPLHNQIESHDLLRYIITKSLPYAFFFLHAHRASRSFKFQLIYYGFFFFLQNALSLRLTGCFE